MKLTGAKVNALIELIRTQQALLCAEYCGCASNAALPKHDAICQTAGQILNDIGTPEDCTSRLFDQEEAAVMRHMARNQGRFLAGRGARDDDYLALLRLSVLGFVKIAHAINEERDMYFVLTPEGQEEINIRRLGPSPLVDE